MKQYIFLIVIFFFSITFVIAQSNTSTQTLRGTVLDKDSKSPLVGVFVQLISEKDTLKKLTNLAGEYQFDSVMVGRAQVSFSCIGFTGQHFTNVEVISAKEVLLNVSLVESSILLETATVTATSSVGQPINDLALISARSVSSEETSRYAGGFNDPSKITSNFAGVATSQNGGNEIVIRGNSPKYIQWRLEGIQINNPNHFGDANGIGGIVNSLNNNLLSTSDFYTGAFPAEFGNAISGVYDIRMRKGNNEKHEGIVSAGLLGTDLTLEGPLSKNYKGSYLINYRYSTIGLANDLNLIDVDGADLSFQDASYKFWLPTSKLGTFSLFGLIGKSRFKFEEVEPNVWVTPNDNFAQATITEDYKKKAHVLNTGVNHTVSVSPKSYLKTSFVYTGDGIDDKVFEKDQVSSSDELNFDTEIVKSAYRVRSVFNKRMNTKHKINLGIQFNRQNEKFQQSQINEQGVLEEVMSFNEGISSLNTFINWKYTPNNKLSIVTGLHNTSVFYNSKYTLEPRIALSYKLNKSNTVSFGYGNHSAMESLHNYFVVVDQPNGSSVSPNKDLGLLRSDHCVVGYEKMIGDKLRFLTEAYLQDHYNLPVENDSNSSYSTINEGLVFRHVDLVNEGKSKNYGIEFTLERTFYGSYYFMLNSSVYESKYTALDQVQRNTKYNHNYIVNALGGKEFRGLGKRNNQVLSLNMKINFTGGQYYIPLIRDENGDVSVDVENGEIYDESKAYENKLDDIINVVFSVSYKWNKNKTTHELYLNIDNITNHEARLSEYYDASKVDGVGYVTQVGTIPNLLYRVYF